MIAYIEGKIVHKSPTFFIIDNGQIGFQIHISLNTFNAIQHLESVRLFTHLNIKKEGQSFSGFELFGFFEESERIMFELLISVSGIGANTARVMLSSMNTNEIAGAILIDNEKAISSIKGIGPKTAKRVILELKDKVAKTNTSGEITFTQHNTSRDEALVALTLLGFNKNTATNALNSIVKSYPNSTVEEMIKHALKIL